MGKFTRFSIAALILSISLASCVNKDYKVLGSIDWTMGADMSILGPIGHSKIKLYEPLPSTFNSFKFRVENDEVYLCRQDTQHLGNEITGHLKMYPKGVFENYADVTVDAQDVYKGTIDEIFEYNFSDINTNPNERLDSIMYKDGQVLVINLSGQVTPASGSYIEIEGDAAGIGFDPAKYPENKMRFDIDEGVTQLNIDIARAIIRFNGGKTLSYKLTGKIFSATPIPAGTRIRFQTEFNNLQPRITYGYLGPSRVIYETTKKIPFAYTKDLEGTDFFLPFYNPVIYLDGINSIGIPAEYEIDYVALAYGPKEERDTVFADFNGSKGTKFTLNYPTPSEIDGLSREQLIYFNTPSIEKTTQFKLDRDYGHTDRLFQVKGDTMVYHYRIRPIEVQGKNVAYFFDDAKIDIITDAEMNMRFAGNTDDPTKNFYIDRIDTVKVDFKGMSIEQSPVTPSDETMARIKLDFINHLPVDGVCDYWFVDQNIQIILPSKKGSVAINAAPVNQDGVVTADAAEVNAYIKFNYADFKELTQKGYAVMLKYRVANKEMKNIWFKSNDWIDGTVEVWAKGFVTYDPSKKGGEK